MDVGRDETDPHWRDVERLKKGIKRENEEELKGEEERQCHGIEMEDIPVQRGIVEGKLTKYPKSYGETIEIDASEQQ